MNRLPLTSAAAALFRALVARAGLPAQQMVISEAVTVDWHSLTLDGERHRFSLRLSGEGCREAVEALCRGLEEAEFDIPNWIVADIALAGPPRADPNGVTEVTIEALTIRE